MNIVKILGCIFCILLFVSCTKDNKEKFDEYSGSKFEATITFTPEVFGTYATNQSKSTISEISLTSVLTTNFGIDSARLFSVSFNCSVTNSNGSISHPDYILSIFFKAPDIDGSRLKAGTYITTINKNSGADVFAGSLSVRDPGGLFPNSWPGSYPKYSFTNLPYSKVTITKSYTLNLSTGISSWKKTFVDGTFDVYFVASSFSESSEVHIVGAFSGAEMIY